MATQFSGGQGQLREAGSFEVRYTADTPKMGIHDRTRRFTSYAKAQTFFDSIDHSAALWDVTHYGELCDAKSRVAYFSGQLQSNKKTSLTEAIKKESSDTKNLAEYITFYLRRRGWQLVAGSIREIPLEEYELLPAESEWDKVVERLFPKRASPKRSQ